MIPFYHHWSTYGRMTSPFSAADNDAACAQAENWVLRLLSNSEQRPVPTPEKLLLQREAYFEVQKALLSRLTPREERVLRLRACEELTFFEIGERLGVTISRVRQLYERAKLKLSKHTELRAYLKIGDWD